MNLESLLNRAQEIETAITTTTNQLNILFGHKNETTHWIDHIKKASNDAKDETPVASAATLHVN